MKRFLIIIFIGLLISCSKIAFPPQNAEETLESMMQAWASLDEDGLLSVLMDSEEDYFLGTDSNEIWIGNSAFMRAVVEQFGSFDSIDIRNIDRKLQYSPSGDAAWFTDIADWTISIGQENIALSGVRMTGVFTYENDSWKLRNMHTSLGVNGQAAAY
jgi:hypothetical protein